MAFALISGSNLKSEPNYIKWLARYNGESPRLVPVHECAENDYGRFYSHSTRSMGLYEKIKQ